MSNLISSTMLRSSTLTTSMSSSAIQALALSPATAAIFASRSASLLTPTNTGTAHHHHHPAFIPPVSAILVPIKRSSSTATSGASSGNLRIHQQQQHHQRTPSFGFINPSTMVLRESKSEPELTPPNFISDNEDSGSEASATTVVPTNKSLRYKLHIPPKPTASTSEADALVDAIFQSPATPLVVGHRGALYDELENTREGFIRCADLGCDAVELDVFLLKDQTLVVFHGGGSDDNPGDLLDYCGVEGNILDLTYEQTQSLGFNPKFEEFPCPEDKIKQGRIPTLEQVLLDLKPTKTHIKIELKGPGVVEPVLDLVDRLGMVGQCEFSSFEHDRIKLVRDLRPQKGPDGRYVYKTGALFEDIPEDFVARAVAVGASEVHLRYDYCTVERIGAIHAANMDSMCWFRGPIGMKSDTATKYLDIGNEDESCYQALIDTGVKQLCVNRPDVLIGLLKKQQQEEARQQQQQLIQDLEQQPQVLTSTLMEELAEVIPAIVDDDESMTSSMST
jgi:glycerophosphoryl diester phosphodiesterase